MQLYVVGDCLWNKNIYFIYGSFWRDICEVLALLCILGGNFFIFGALRNLTA
jgi:hypothetical protein